MISEPETLTPELKPAAFDPLYVDAIDFSDRILTAYTNGTAEKMLPADLGVANSWIPAGTGAQRDFSYIAPYLPALDAAKCVGCMECVVECPDTAILAKVVPAADLPAALQTLGEPMFGRSPNSNFAKQPNITTFRRGKAALPACS